MTAPVVLSGGELLLSGAAVADVGRALRIAERHAARDGIRPSLATRALMRAVDESLTRQAASAVGSAEVPLSLVCAESFPEDHDVIGTRDAAALMGRTDRDVRDLCARGSLVTARRSGGRWLVDRAEVLDRIEKRDAEHDRTNQALALAAGL